MPSSTQRIVREIRALGWQVTFTRGGHLKCTHPDAATPIFCAASPSDSRNEKMVLALLRRALRAGRRKP
jgi:predicted RNA binding protein YcfA (HicA-like mRNA interferase family)